MTKYTSYTKKNNSKKFWQVKGYLGTNQKTGEEKYFNRRGFSTKLDAKDAYEAAQAEFKAQTTIVKKITRVRFSDVYEQWWPLYKPNVEPSTSSKVKKQFENHILPELGEYFVDAITIMDAEKWTLDVAKRFVRWDDFKARASQIMRFAVRCGYIQTNPFDYIQNPRKGKVAKKTIKQNWFDLEELRTFMETLRAMSQEDVSPNQQWAMSHAFLSVTASTGMRRSEVRALKWSDINWETGELKVQRAVKYSDELGEYIGATKTVSGMRQLLLDGDAIDALRTWQADQLQWRQDQGQQMITKENWIFTSQDDPTNLMSGDDPTRWMTTVCKTAGVHRISLHGLRHTKATLSSQAGADIADIAAVLGHSNGRFTLGHYIHQTKSGVVRAESLFNKYVAGEDTRKTVN
ncbi:tyrosine-type recombinase/integrase [Lacticaseibacillus sp. GG6-2]